VEVNMQTTLEEHYGDMADRAYRATRARDEFAVTVAGIMDIRGCTIAGDCLSNVELQTLAEEAARRNGLTLEEAFKTWQPWGLARTHPA
jgi:hypothetical protein